MDEPEGYMSFAAAKALVATHGVYDPTQVILRWLASGATSARVARIILTGLGDRTVLIWRQPPSELWEHAYVDSTSSTGDSEFIPPNSHTRLKAQMTGIAVEEASLRAILAFSVSDSLPRTGSETEFTLSAQTVQTIPANSECNGGGRASFTSQSGHAELVAWYTNHIAAAPSEGYTRADDEAACRAVGISRERWRDLRRQHAPVHWHKDGPRNQAVN
jgi:hypothetical protein